MSKVWFSFYVENGIKKYMYSNQPYENSILIDSSYIIYDCCQIHVPNNIDNSGFHLKEIKCLRIVFQCCACRKETKNPQFALVNKKGIILSYIKNNNDIFTSEK